MNSADSGMVVKKEWIDFQNAGLLWWVNRILHLFGWAIVFQIESDGTISEVYPARCKYRGFGEKDETEGFIKLTEHIRWSLPEMLEDVKEENQ